MINIGLLIDDDTDYTYLNQLSGDLPFHISGVYHSPHLTKKLLKGFERWDQINDPSIILNESDALLILQNRRLDLGIAVSALKQFKHLFFSNASLIPEKEFQNLLKLSREANTIIRAGNQSFYQKAFYEAIKEVNNPLYFEFIRPDAFCIRNLDKLKACLMSDIELALSLSKSQVRKVQAHSVIKENGIHQLISARIEFDNGASSTLTYTTLLPEKERILKIYQPNQCLLINFSENVSQKNSVLNGQKKSSRIITKPSRNYPINKRKKAFQIEGKNELFAFAEDISKAMDRHPIYEDSFNASIVSDIILKKIQA